MVDWKSENSLGNQKIEIRNLSIFYFLEPFSIIHLTIFKMLTSKPTNLQENVGLATHTTFRIGGPARYFAAVKNNEELIEAVKWTKENSLPFFILGGGSNLLVSDEGYEGLVIKCQMTNFQCQKESDKLKIICGAGVPFGKAIMETSKQGYSGAEWGFGIPGTIGGALCGNAGRLGQDISKIVQEITILDADLNIKKLTREECEFDYRHSRFKETREIILSAVLEFTKKDQMAIDEVLNEAKAVVKHSPPFSSAGCIFKNYRTMGEQDELLKNHPELAGRVRGGKLGVGFLIDQCGLAGRQIGGAKVWEGHANYIVNVGGAKAEDVLALIALVKKSVKEKWGIELEDEVRYLGNFKL